MTAEKRYTVHGYAICLFALTQSNNMDIYLNIGFDSLVAMRRQRIAPDQKIVDVMVIERP